MNRKEVLGYLLTVKSAGLLVPLCLLEGITHLEFLSWLFWILLPIALGGICLGLSIASSGECDRIS